MSTRVEALIARLEDPEQFMDALDGPGGAVETLRELDMAREGAEAALLAVCDAINERIQRECGEQQRALSEGRSSDWHHARAAEDAEGT